MTPEKLRRKLAATKANPAPDIHDEVRRRLQDEDTTDASESSRKARQSLFLSKRPSISRAISAILIGYICYQWGHRTGSRFISDEFLDEEGSSVDIGMHEHKASLSNAVTTLRCLTTPGCYPRLPCSSGRDPAKIAISRDWEEHAFCVHDVEGSHRRAEKMQTKNKRDRREPDPQPCLVYSFGIAGSVEWERKMSSQLGCEVYAFDPTSNFGERVAPGVKFYPIGLKGAGNDGTDVSATHSEMYGAIDPSKLRTLGEIVRMFGHENREIDVLRLDCEGCEWSVLKELACSGESRHVRQLMVEFHFQKNLGLASDEDVQVAADAINCLEEERWGIVSMQKSGCGKLDALYIDPAAKVVKDFFFLTYITMRRAPNTERMPWEELLVASEANVDLIEYEKRYNKVHGPDPYQWPSHLQEEWRQRDDKLSPHIHRFDSIYKKGDLGFEVYERYPEKR
ncbi:hypothetical protein ACHAXT_011710 [Thalassiosira profunda]